MELAFFHLVTSGQMSAKVETLPHFKLNFGKGIHWDEKTETLFFTDVFHGTVYSYNTKTRTVLTQSIAKDTISFIIPILRTSDSFICGEGLSIKFLEWNKQRNAVLQYKHVKSLDNSLSDLRLHEGKCDRSGRLWCGTTSRNEFQPLSTSTILPEESTLDIDSSVSSVKPQSLVRFKDGYQIKPRGTLYSYTMMQGKYKQCYDLDIPNGMTWSLDNETMFFTDSSTNKIDAFSFDINLGTIVNRRCVFNFLDNNCVGQPDSMTIDCYGNLWVACYEGNQVINVDPECGKIITQVHFNANQITSLTFGGRYMNELYVLSSNRAHFPYEPQEESTQEKNSEAGSIFKVIGLNVKGTTCPKFDIRLQN